MVKDDRQTIFIVDDDLKICREICELLCNEGFKTSYFINPARCLNHLNLMRCDLLIADYKMPEMNGIELMKEAKSLLPWLPVIIISGYGDIPLAVNAIKEGAVNFLEKPLDKHDFLSKIKSILQEEQNINDIVNNSLTKMEMKVLVLILEGNNNKECANLLNRSKRTIETHRANLMKKFRVNNVVDLIRKTSQIKIIDIQKNSKSSDIK